MHILSYNAKVWITVALLASLIVLIGLMWIFSRPDVRRAANAPIITRIETTYIVQGDKETPYRAILSLQSRTDGSVLVRAQDGSYPNWITIPRAQAQEFLNIYHAYLANH
jgi:hypothetical protein